MQSKIARKNHTLRQGVLWLSVAKHSDGSNLKISTQTTESGIERNASHKNFVLAHIRPLFSYENLLNGFYNK